MSSLDAFYSGGPKTTQEAFPPVCMRTHWDPTRLATHVLPNFTNPVQLAFDPRPSAFICTQYYTTSPGDARLDMLASKPLPVPSALLGGQRVEATTSSVFPPGGAAGRGFPYTQYAQAINSESDLYRLDEPLTKCAERRWMGPPARNIATNVVPNSDASILSASALEVRAQAGCRNADDESSWNRSARLFFNPTRYDRTTTVPDNLYLAESQGALACKPY
jgi:hypothetical protein